MSRKIFVPIFALLVVALMAGCAAPTPQPVPPTKTPKPTFTPTPDWTPTALAYPTTAPVVEQTAAPSENTPEAGATTSGEAQATTAPEATAAPTEAPAPTVTRFTANQNVNVRSGPGTVYPAIGRLTAGQSFDVAGRNDAGDWIKFDFNGRDGWVTFALVSIEGDLNGVQVAQAPAVPTARPQPTARPRPAQPTAVPQPTQPPAPPPPQFPFQYVEGSANCQPNAGTTYFNGVVRYRNNEPRNGVCVHIAFFGPRQTKCSGCGGVGNGNWGFSPFGGGQPPAGTTVEIYVVGCQGVPEGGQDQATGFSDLTPKSNKFVRTLNSGEQCTGITFVGD